VKKAKGTTKALDADKDSPAPKKSRKVGPKLSKEPIQYSVNLPEHLDWYEGIGVNPRTKPYLGRIAVSNRESADKLANAIVPKRSKGKVIVEAYPGPGQLTRSLLNLPRERVSKIVVMEPIIEFVDWLKPLQAVDDRLVIMHCDPYEWSSYDMLVEEGHLDGVPVEEWGPKLHSTLQFVQHLPTTVIGEQLLNQYVRTVPDRHWLFKYGRVPLDLITTYRIWQRTTATEKNIVQRCKLGVLAQATGTLSATIPADQLEPYDDHFYPPTGFAKVEGPAYLERGRVGAQHTSIRFEPFVEPIIKPGKLDSWDFVARKLFISKATPVSKSICTLAHGAGSLLKPLTDPSKPPEERVDPKLGARQLTVHDWKNIVDAFDNWPFRPENLAIDVDMLPYGKHRK